MTALLHDGAGLAARTGPAEPGRSRSRAIVAGAAATLEPIDLPAVMSVAALQTRTDAKYLLTVDQFAELVEEIGSRFLALQIDGTRSFGYESVYFDTPDLALFRAHRQRRRRRFKVRTRTYLDSGESMFEVKLKGRRGETRKHRMRYDSATRTWMTPAADAFAGEVLRDEYGLPLPDLESALVTTYTRSTLVDPEDGARLTCDVDLVCSDLRRRRSGPDMVLLESKSAGGTGLADRVLKALRVRPASLSKYCIGTALLRPYLAANPWNQVLRRDFGWARHQAAGRMAEDEDVAGRCPEPGGGSHQLACSGRPSS